MENKNKYLSLMISKSSTIFLFSILGYILVFIIKILTARIFGPEQFGVYELIITILNILFTISLVGISTGIPIFIPIYFKTDKQLLKGYFKFIVQIPLILSAIISILLLIFSKQIGQLFNLPLEYTSLLKIISLILPLKVISSILRQIMIAKRIIFEPSLSYNLIEKVILIIGLSLIGGKTNLIILIFIATLVSFFYDVIIFKKMVEIPKEKVIKKKNKEWFKFSIPLLFISVLAYLINWTDNIMIAKLLEPTSLGIYSIAYSLSVALFFFRESFSTIFTPLISENYALNNRHIISFLFNKSKDIIIGSTLPIGFLLILKSKTIISILFGTLYQSGNIPLIILTVGFLISIFFGLNYNLLILHKKTKYLFKLTSTIALLNVLLNLILIPILGIIGAAIASSTSIVLQNFFMFLKAKKLEKINLTSIKGYKVILASLISVLVIKLTNYFLMTNIYIDLILTTTIFFSCYITLLIMFNFFDKEDLFLIEIIENKLKIKLDLVKKFLK